MLSNSSLKKGFVETLSIILGWNVPVENLSLILQSYRAHGNNTKMYQASGLYVVGGGRMHSNDFSNLLSESPKENQYWCYFKQFKQST